MKGVSPIIITTVPTETVELICGLMTEINMQLIITTINKIKKPETIAKSK